MLPRPLALYLSGSFLARVADEAVGVAVALLALERTGSAAQGAAVLTAWTAPHVLVAPATGALVAKARRPVVVYVTALAVVATSIGGIAMSLGRLPLVAVLSVAAVGGCCGPLVTGGLSSLVASLTVATDRPRAYALDSAVYTGATLAGPTVVTLIGSRWSAGVATAALAVAAAAAALLVCPLRLPRLARPRKQVGTGTALATGLTAIWRDGVLRGLTGATCLAYLGIGGLPIAAVLIADTWTRSTDGGLLMTSFGAGALVGAMALARWRPPVTATGLAGGCLLGSAFALAGAAVSPSLTFGLVVFAGAGLCDGPLLSATLQARAEHAPEHARPQVFTMGAALKVSAAAAGAALVGVAADVPPAVLVVAVAALQAAAFAALQLLPRAPVRATTATD